MTGDRLIAEGERLARPCVYLRTTSGREDFAAVWGGEGVVPCGEGPFRHWLSIDCRFLPPGRTPGAGCISVYTDESDCVSGVVSLDPVRPLPSDSGGVKLSAHPGSSLPPIDAVFKLGSPDVQEWLSSIGWGSDWGFIDNFPDRGVSDAYERAYQDRLPLYAGGAHAVLGGWHFPWPDGDWDELVDQRLIVWTFVDSEPWVEVWEDQGRFRVTQRVS